MRTLSIPLAGLLVSTLLGACTADGPTTPSSLAAGRDGIAATRGQQDKPLPFRATVRGQVTVGVGPSDCPAGTAPASVTDGGGVATRLGRFTIVSQTACLTATGGVQGSFVWRAANGDLLTATFTFSTTAPDASGRVTVTAVHVTITGGTGRFAGASGTLELDEGVFQLLSPTTFLFDVALRGTIVYDASRRAGS